MSKTAPSLVDTLFEAHVKHEVAALKGAKLKKFLEQEVDELLGYAEKVPLGRLISPEQVMGVVKRIAVNMELDAGIPELGAEMAAEGLKARVQADTALGDVLAREQAGGCIDDALELGGQ